MKTFNYVGCRRSRGLEGSWRLKNVRDGDARSGSVESLGANRVPKENSVLEGILPMGTFKGNPVGIIWNVAISWELWVEGARNGGLKHPQGKFGE